MKFSRSDRDSPCQAAVFCYAIGQLEAPKHLRGVDLHAFIQKSRHEFVSSHETSADLVDLALEI